MSLRYKGARLSATPPTTTGGTTVGANAAPGIWTLDQQMKAQGQSAWPSVGNFIEDVFSTWVYAGNSATQTVTNNINLSGQGGLVWVKNRTSNSTPHRIWDTVQGGTISSNLTAAKDTYYGAFFSASSTGFNLNSTGAITDLNQSGENYVSWTFRKQAKFFDLVTYTGNGTAGRTVPHNLGSVPGCIIVKSTTFAGTNWAVYHRSLTSNQYALQLNNTGAQLLKTAYWDSTTPTSTDFTIGNDADVNQNGQTYVAYLFAHDAGGFGAAGTDNVISCGTYNGNSTTNSINLGYEPQWVLIKRTTVAASDWILLDNMRGLTVGTSDAALSPNNANAEGATVSVSGAIRPTATGFDLLNSNSALNVTGSSYIYIAIRRGPMKTPTSGTSVFTPIAATGSTGTSRTVGFVADMTIGKTRAISDPATVEDRLRGFANTNAIGAAPQLRTSSTSAELTSQYPEAYAYTNTTRLDGQYANTYSNIWWHFARAPGFFDVVCYTGTGVTNRTVTHNLTVAPELLFVKARNNIQNWSVLCTLSGGLQGRLNTTAALSAPSAAVWGNGTSYVAPTSTVFTVGTDNETNANTWTYVAYLFATVAGVSKVGSYQGNGTSLTVPCGFTAGSRFVMIKRTDSTGDWYVWDSARGIVAGNDPYLSLNTTAAEVTTDDSVDTDSSGFIVNQVAATNVNVNNATYIFLAIA